MKLALTHPLSTLLLILVTHLTLISNAQSATVYKKVDDKGNLVFSDEPFEGAEKIDVPPVPTINLHLPKALPLPTRTTTTNTTTAAAYTSVTISSPKNDSAIVNTGGAITVSVNSTPTLQNDHQYKLLVNGENKGSQSGGSFSLNNISRGAHTSVVQIVDSKGEVIKVSSPVTFYVRQHSIKH